jgi:hypothetical protein
MDPRELSSADAEYLCRLAGVFYKGRKSMRQLVEETGVDTRDLRAEALEPVLRKNPELIEEWQRWSENRRTSSGWFLAIENGSPVVGHMPDRSRQAFPDLASACAEFIAREIGDIGSFKK